VICFKLYNLELLIEKFVEKLINLYIIRLIIVIKRVEFMLTSKDCISFMEKNLNEDPYKISINYIKDYINKDNNSKNNLLIESKIDKFIDIKLDSIITKLNHYRRLPVGSSST
jgi:hypothetical protein